MLDWLWNIVSPLNGSHRMANRATWTVHPPVWWLPTLIVSALAFAFGSSQDYSLGLVQAVSQNWGARSSLLKYPGITDLLQFKHPSQWRPTGLSCLCLWTTCVLSFRLDFHLCTHSRFGFVYLLESRFHYLLRSGGNAVIGLIFAEYLNRLLWHTTRDEVSPDDIPQWAIKLTAVAAILLVSFICAATRNLGARAALVFTSLKACSALDFLLFTTHMLYS